MERMALLILLILLQILMNVILERKIVPQAPPALTPKGVSNVIVMPDTLGMELIAQVTICFFFLPVLLLFYFKVV